MSMLAAAEPTPTQFLILYGFVALSMLLAWLLGVFRPRNIEGPPRIATDEPVGILWGLALSGFGVWLMSPALFVWMIGVKPTGDPPKLDLTPRQTVSVLIAAEVVAVAVMLIAGMNLRRLHLARLGLTLGRIPGGLIAAVIGAIVAIPPTILSVQLVEWIWRHLGNDAPQQQEMLNFFRQPDLLTHRMVIFSAVVIAPIFEELLFRGHLQTALRYTLRMPWLAVIVTSLLFASIHVQDRAHIWMIPPLTLLAICLGYAYERTGNLWVSIGMHAMFNGLSLALASQAH